MKHVWMPANIYLNIQGSVGLVFLLQKDSKTKDGLRIAYPLRVEEENQGVQVSVR